MFTARLCLLDVSWWQEILVLVFFYSSLLIGGGPILSETPPGAEPLWGYQHDTSYSPSTPRCCLVHSPLVLHRGPECILSRKSQIASGCISGAPHPVWPDWKKPQSDSALLSAHVYVSSEPSVQSPPLYRSQVWSVLTALPDLSEGICLVCLSKLTEERTEKTLQDKIHL